MKQSVTDKVIGEIRQARERASIEFHHDPDKLISYLQGVERKYSQQIALYTRSHPYPRKAKLCSA